MTVGKVWLVGAGPGRADLISVKGLRLIRSCDVLLYDRLIPCELTDETKPDCEKLFVGKKPGAHVKPQDEINRLLLEYARDGKMIVRLKGGDPFLFGRGGEEMLELASAGIPFEVVPGITSAIGVLSEANIPVTHKGVATGFAIVTGHEAEGKPGTTTDWDSIAHVPTVIVLMGVKKLSYVVDQLLTRGRHPQTPAAIISNGMSTIRREYLSTLEELPALAMSQVIESPSITVIGDVVAVKHQLEAASFPSASMS